MKKVFFFCLLASPFFSFAQTDNKNEIGVGIGSVEYNTSQYPFSNQQWKFYIPFSTSYLPRMYGMPNTYFNTVLPEVYYSRNISSVVRAFVSYQFVSGYGYNKNIIHVDDGPSVIAASFSSTIHRINGGLDYIFFRRKSFQLYAGLSGGLFVNKNRENVYEGGYLAMDGKEYPDTIVNNTFRIITVQVKALVGIEVPLYKNLNLKYEAGVFYDSYLDGIIILSPVNRFSVNYRF